MFSTFHSSTRRTFCKQIGTATATTLCLGGNALAAHATSSQSAMQQRASWNGINILLVHGAFADASSWFEVIELLQARRYNVLAVQNPLSSLEEDVSITRQALASLCGPTVLVGHSYGGAVISNAGTNAPNLRSLVYIAASVPEDGESTADIGGRFAAPPISAHIIPSYRKGFIWVDPPAFPENFVQDIPCKEARALAVVQKPIRPECFMAPSGPPAWKQVPSWYLVSAYDRAINPEAERFMAKRIGATTCEIASSHASPVSHPHECCEIIVAASRVIPAVVGRG